jgi:hypothetical protein
LATLASLRMLAMRIFMHDRNSSCARRPMLNESSYA